MSKNMSSATRYKIRFAYYGLCLLAVLISLGGMLDRLTRYNQDPGPLYEAPGNGALLVPDNHFHDPQMLSGALYWAFLALLSLLLLIAPVIWKNLAPEHDRA